MVTAAPCSLLYCALRDWKGTESVIVVRGDGGRVEVGMCEVKEGDLSHVATAQLTGEVRQRDHTPSLL